MRLVLAPWERIVEPDGQVVWIKPGNDYRGGCIDLRTPAQAAMATGPAQGLGLFAYEDLPASIQVVADLGDDPLARMTPSRRNALADALGIGRRNLSDGSLGQLLGEQLLGQHADPSGTARVKPLKMNARGAEVRIRGFGRIWRARLDKAHPVYARTIETRRLDYERNRTLLMAQAQDEIRGGRDRDEALAAALMPLQKWTGWDRRALSASEDELLPPAYRADRSREPETTLTESWPTNGTTISSGQDQAWNEDSGNVSVASGRLELGSGSAYGRCTNALSSDDHSHAASGSFASTTEAHHYKVCVRKINSTVETFYCIWVRQEVAAGADGSLLRRLVSGTSTQLDGNTDDPGVGPHAASVQANGSSISAARDAVSLGPVTDTTITGNLLVGYGFGITGSAARLDDHTFEDIAVSPYYAYAQQ